MLIKLILSKGTEGPFMELIEAEDEHGKSLDLATVGMVSEDAEYRNVTLDVLPPLDKVTLQVREATGDRLYSKSELIKLVWLPSPRNSGVFTADVPFGHYTVFPDGEWWGPQVGNNTGNAGNIEAAKLACQADLEARAMQFFRE